MNDHYDERLQFSGAGAHYDPYESAQHVVRYASVRNFVNGARVLDVACGEGYGAKLMCDWGAREVVGVDISSEAVAAAREMFGSAERTFVVGNVEEVDAIPAVAGPFDVIVSFETIEHIDDPEAFLRAIRSLLAPDGVIAISCPNEEGLLGEGESNPFHVRRLDFEAFRALTEGVLGKATTWLLGSPVAGEMNLTMDLADRVAGGTEALAIVKATAVDNSLVLPALSSHRVTTVNCTHFLGVWGRHAMPNATVSPQSYESFFEAWRANAWLNDQQRFMTTEHENQTKTLQAECENRIKAIQAECENRIKVEKQANLSETESLRQKVLEIAEEVTHWRRESLLFEREANRLRPFEHEIISMQQQLAALEGFRLTVERSRLFRVVKVYGRTVHHPTMGKPLRFLRRLWRLVRRR